MQRYVPGSGATSLDGLAIIELDTPRPGSDAVLVRVRACSISYRCQAVVLAALRLRSRLAVSPR